jgi:hypothetical protein
MRQGLAAGTGDRADRHADRMADRFAVGHARAWGMLLWGRLSVYDSK